MKEGSGEVGRISGSEDNRQCCKCGQYHPSSQVVEILIGKGSSVSEYICRGCLARLSGSEVTVTRKGRQGGGS